jgi:4-amino-4-deoxy-L-arabinose transferase-like glycosyltransferase
MTDHPPLNLREGSSPEDSRARRRSLAVILVVALLGRLVVLVNVALTRPRNWLFSRPYEMGLLADSLLHGHGFSSPFGVPTGPTAFIAPGYPTLIAAVFFLFGIDSFASEIAIIALQILVGLVTIWLMMRIARQLLDDRTAILAGAFWAVSLPLLWVPAIFWETSLSACALPAIILLALGCRRRPTIPAWLLLGVSSAIVALINPALLPTLLAILAWAAWQTRRVARAAPLLGLLALLLLFSPWPIRNAYRFHAFVPLRSTAGFELWMGNRPGATGFLDQSLFPMYDKTELASYVAKGEVAYTRDKSSQAWDYIRAHPAIFIRLSLRRCFRFWAGTGNAGGPPIFELHALLTTILGFTGLVFLYRNRMRAFAVLMALPLLLFPLPYYITHAEFRYRVNIDPLLTLLAAYALTQLAARWPRPIPSTPPPPDSAAPQSPRSR